MKNKMSNINSKILKFVLIPEITSIIPVIIVIIVAIIGNPAFLNPKNLYTLSSTLIGTWGLLAIGQAFIVMSGELDISMGASLSFAGMMFAFLVKNNVPLGIIILAVIVVCILVSLANALVVLKFNVPAFIATLSMQYICRGLANIFTYGSDISIISSAEDPAIRAFFAFTKLKPLGVSIAAWLFIVLIIIANIIIKKTAFGMKISAVGDNKRAAKTAGIKVTTIKTMCFVIGGIMVSIATIFWIGYYQGFSPGQGLPWTFVAICAVAMGGISLKGGSGSIIGVFFGVFLMALIYNLITLLKVNSNYQNIFMGCFLILAVILDTVRRDKTIGKNI